MGPGSRQLCLGAVFDIKAINVSRPPLTPCTPPLSPSSLHSGTQGE